MTDFNSMNEQQMCAAIADIVNKASVTGLVEFGRACGNMASATEAQQKVLVRGAVELANIALPKLGEETVSEDLINCLINGCDVLVKGTAESARNNALHKTMLGRAQVSGREVLGTAFSAAGRLPEAVNVLREMPLDSGLPTFEEDYKFSLYVKLAELELQCGNDVRAENHLNSARPLEKSGKVAQGARDRFNVCYAQVLDSNRKFVEAANRYFLVSSAVEDASALETLRRATVCATMAEPSEQRNRILGALYRDERRGKMGEMGEVISKLFHHRVMRAADIEALQPHLLAQHKALSADKVTTAFDIAIHRHNVVSASKIYTAITFQDLGALLGTTPEQAEHLAATMAAQGRISATIDQLQGCVSFVGNAAVPILRWDSQIDTVGNLIASVAETIVKRHPELSAKGGL